ncbi:hypothetical protein [uncultured Brachybacterium sp.]|nr:hypothetical protein [uncultured Brachybacterium sp.]
MTPTTSPAIPVASSSGGAASPTRHHGAPVTLRAVEGGRSTADGAGLTAS